MFIQWKLCFINSFTLQIWNVHNAQAYKMYNCILFMLSHGYKKPPFNYEGKNGSKNQKCSFCFQTVYDYVTDYASSLQPRRVDIEGCNLDTVLLRKLSKTIVNIFSKYLFFLFFFIFFSFFLNNSMWRHKIIRPNP